MRWLLLFLLSPALAAELFLFTPEGPLRGEAQDGVGAVFGLVYAQAERFAAPRLVEGLRQGPVRACPQPLGLTAQFGGYVPPQEEDCLQVQVYFPLKAPPKEGFPVMVFLHGGSFLSGSGAEPIYAAWRLAREGAVVLLPNYRLGALGFLALPALKEEDLVAVGNYGLLDTLLALRFAQRVAPYFGGNPENLTLFGQSAGSMLACTLLALPEARGLIQKAILQSGGCAEVRPLEGDFRVGERVARRAGCDPGDLACLRKAPLKDLVPGGGGSLEATSFLSSPFKPHLNPRLLPKRPLEALLAGEARGVPLLAGATAEEVPPGEGPRSFAGFAEALKGERPQVREALLAHYQSRFPDPRRAYAAYQTERTLLCPTLKAARVQMAFAPTYAYLFTFRVPGLEALGAFHGLDLAPLFGNLQEMPFLPLFLHGEAKEQAEALGQGMRRYFVAFARDGEPKGWPRPPLYREGMVLRLDHPTGLLPDPYEERCGLLERLGLL
ncbi:carboxylesterase/lipase family protein [Thermus sp.]